MMKWRKKMKKIPTFIKNFMKNTTIQEISSAVL